MGCRPSRRAVACVRVAGEGPWGSGRSNRPRTLTGDNSVKLRHRGSRCSRDEGGRDEGGNGVYPRDRYSAPPVDRQFPPHSCTSAVYEHGCCGTSRITLRLSKNGSTLEIEKCDFQHGVKSCQVCGTAGTQHIEQHYLDAPLRAQSAPNLTVTVRDHKYGNPPRSSQHCTKQVVESHPPPLPMRHMERLSAMASASVVSPPESVCTATRINVDIENVAHSRPSCSNDSSFRHQAETHSTSISEKVNSIKSHSRPETLYCSTHNESYSEDLQRDPHIQNENADTYSCPYSPSSEDLSRLLRDADSLLINDYDVGSENVDLTKLESTNPVSSEVDSDDSDVECSSIVEMNCSRTPVDELRVVEISGNTRSDSMGDHNIQIDNAQKTSVLIHDSADSSFDVGTCIGSVCHEDDKPVMPGATDYRIRMLGVQKNVITSQLTNREAGKCYKGNMVTQVRDGNMILVSCDGSIPRENSIRSGEDLEDDSAAQKADTSRASIVNGGEGISQAAVRVKNLQVAESADMAMKLGQCHDKQTERNCFQDRGGKMTHRLVQRETSQSAFFYADFENDNVEDVLNNSSSGLESLC